MPVADSSPRIEPVGDQGPMYPFMSIGWRSKSCSLAASTVGGCEGDLHALVVDIAVARQADDHEFACAVEVGEREHDVLQRVRGGPLPLGGASRCALAWATSVAIVGVFGESKMTGSGSPSNGIGPGATVVNASTLAA